MTYFILISAISFVLVSQSLVTANECNSNDYVYGQNEVVDQLLICSMGKSFDLDLKPHGDYYKKTSKTLIDQGLSNRTSIIHARLNGLWSAKRASFVESGWKCGENATTVSSIIELSGLSLEVVEKVDIPLHKNQHNLAQHKPCKTFDIPLWMCRQTKPIYRTTKTWVNRAYFNMTLNQQVDAKKPAIAKLAMIFTCPETFKQKITYSPSAMYILSKFVQGSVEIPQDHVTKATIRKRSVDKGGNSVTSNKFLGAQDQTALTHPVSYAKTQDGRGLASPPYHDSVNLIMRQVSEVLRSSLDNCINLLDSDLSLMADYSSFDQNKYGKVGDNFSANDGVQKRIENECSSKLWIKNKIELANRDDARDDLNEEQNNSANPSKRSQFLLKYPSDPNELLNPYGYYHNNLEQMVDDN